MIVFFLQTLFYMAVAFGLGCLCGCWLKGRFGAVQPSASGVVTHDGAARTPTAGEPASSRPHHKPTPSSQASAASTPKPVQEARSEAGKGPEAKSDMPEKAARIKATSAPTNKATTPEKTKPAAKSASGNPAARKSAAAPVAPMPASPKTTKPKPAKLKPAKAEAAAVADDLKQIKGVGPRIEAKLNAAGINSFAQIAAWNKKQQADFAEQLSFAGRIEREDWVAQAKILAKGGSTDFSKRVAKGEVASSAGGKSKRGGKT